MPKGSGFGRSPTEEETERALSLRRAYRDVFSSPQGAVVLADLRQFCRAGKVSFVIDDPGGRKTANFEGRRSAVLYVEAMRAESDDPMRALLDIT